MNLQNLTQQQLVGGLTDLLTAVNQKFTNPSSDLVLVEDMVSLAASLDVPGAGEAEVALVIITALWTVLYPYWVPPWSPAYTPPNANRDPTTRPAR